MRRAVFWRETVLHRVNQTGNEVVCERNLLPSLHTENSNNISIREMEALGCVRNHTKFDSLGWGRGTGYRNSSGSHS